jgi:hypothetical protein
LRQCLSERAGVPPEFNLHEVFAILRAYYAEQDASTSVPSKLG